MTGRDRMRGRAAAVTAVVCVLALSATACQNGNEGSKGESVVPDVTSQGVSTTVPSTTSGPGAGPTVSPTVTGSMPGSDDGGSPTSSAPVDTLREDLRGALLAIEDLQGGWTLVSTDENPHQGSVFCDTPFEVGTAPTFRLTAVFQETDTKEVLSQRISAYPEGGAEKVMSEFRLAIEDCDEWTKITDTGSQTWRLFPLELNEFGDDTIALDLPTTVGALTIDNHFVMMRFGDVITILGYGGPFVDAIDPEVTEIYARLAADKLEEVT